MYLDAKLKKLDFVYFEIDRTNARVTTSEDWSYTYRDLDTQEIAAPVQSISYKMEYMLEKQTGNWLIEEINILQET